MHISSNELPYFYLDEIFELFGYKTKRSAYVAIDRGCFPVPTYKMARRIVADREVVREFFRRERKRGAIHLDEHAVES